MHTHAVHVLNALCASRHNPDIAPVESKTMHAHGTDTALRSDATTVHNHRRHSLSYKFSESGVILHTIECKRQWKNIARVMI